jgi:hypothetical protein
VAAIAGGAAVAVSSAAWPHHAFAYAAGAFVIFYGLGPGSRTPRAQLRRFFGTVARTRTARVLALAVMTAIVAAAVAAAVTRPAAFWPTTVPPWLTHFGTVHLGPLRRLSYRFGVAHHIRAVRVYLLHHLEQLSSGAG